jgi:Polysaccharide lyase
MTGVAGEAHRLRVALLAGIAGLGIAACATTRGAGPVDAHEPPSQAPRWRQGFEHGDLSGWSFLLNPRGLSVVSAPVAEGKWAARVEIEPGDLWPNGLNRVELQYKPPVAALAEGARSCFGWQFFLPRALSAERHQIGYWESYPSYRQIMSFEVHGEDIAFVTRLPATRIQWQAAGRVTPGVWHRIAMCVRWSADAERGRADVWFDRQHVVGEAAARTLWDGPNLVQIGILRDAPARTEVMFIDEAFEGPTLDVAAIDSPLRP